MKKNMIEFILILIVALAEILLFLFRSSFNNPDIIDIFLIILPLLCVFAFYYRYRFYHYRHIFSKEELEKQHR